MDPKNPGTEVGVAVLEERVSNLCKKIGRIVEGCDNHSETTKNINDICIRLEGRIGTLEQTKKGDKPIEVKFLYEVIRILVCVILTILGVVKLSL